VPSSIVPSSRIHFAICGDAAVIRAEEAFHYQWSMEAIGSTLFEPLMVKCDPRDVK
jgi:hypothetical protein